MSRPRRCLLVESLPYHWEVLPAWVSLLQRLGYDVEIAGGDSPGHRETLELLRSSCRTHELGALADLRLESFDFVLLNSLIHEGYFFQEPPNPRPDLQWLRDFGLPSISVVHEPVFWVEKRIVLALQEAGEHGRRLNLLADGYLQYEMGSWAQERWSLDGDRLCLSEDGRTRVFESTDGGRSYRDLDAARATALLRRDTPAEDLSRHCAAGRHAVITLARSGAKHLAAIYDGVEWLLPLAIRERLPLRVAGEIAFAGAIDYDCKRVPSLWRGCEALGEDQYIRIIGGSRNPAFDEDRFVRTFKREIAERGLESKLRFTGYLPYGEFIERIRGCRFLLPLVDDYVDGGYYLIKLPASIAYSLSLGVPLIVNQSIADTFDLQYMICYPGDDLASGLKAEQSLGAAGYAAMLEALDRHAEALDRRNLEVLAGLIERITGR